MTTFIKGATSKSLYFFIPDLMSDSGSGLTGLVFNSSGLSAYYSREKEAATAITLATLAAATSAYSSGGFKEVDATNMPGVYRLDLPDAVLATGTPDRAVIQLKGAANMPPVQREIDLEESVASQLLATVHSGTAQSDGSGADTLQLASGAVSADDEFNGYIVALVAGAGAGQQRQVLDTTNAGDEIQVVGGAWDTPPDNTTVYVLFGN